MKKRVPEASGSKAKRKGFLSPEANVSWHFLPGSVRPVRLQRALSVPVVGVGRGDAAVAGYAQDLAQQDVRSREASLLTGAARVALSIAYRDVEVAVLAEAAGPALWSLSERGCCLSAPARWKG